MSLYLKIRSHGAEDYDLSIFELAEAIENEARTIADDADAELLADDTTEERDDLYEHVVASATVSLRKVGDTYKDPTGTVWALVEKEDN